MTLSTVLQILIAAGTLASLLLHLSHSAKLRALGDAIDAIDAIDGQAAKFAPPPTPKQAGFASMDAMLALMVVGMAFTIASLIWAMGCSGAQKAAKTGGAAVAACAIGDLTKHASGVEQALAQNNYGAALAQFKTANQLTDDALTCLIQGVIAVLAQPGLLTGQPSIVVLHGKAYLQDHAK